MSDLFDANGDWDEQKVAGYMAVCAMKEKFDDGPLLARLRDANAVVTLEERQIAADIIDGTFKRPAHRASAGETESMGHYIALRAHSLADKGMSRKEAVAELLERPEFKARNIGKPTIEKAITRYSNPMHPSWQRQKRRNKSLLLSD